MGTSWETFKIEGDELLQQVKRIIHEGNGRRVVIKQGSRTVVEFPVTVGVVGAVAAPVALAIVSPSVIGVLSFFYTVLSVCLFVPVMAGLYVRRAGTHEAAGVAVLVAAQPGTGGRGLVGLTPAFLGLPASAVGFGTVGGSEDARPERHRPLQCAPRGAASSGSTKIRT